MFLVAGGFIYSKCLVHLQFASTLMVWFLSLPSKWLRSFAMSLKNANENAGKKGGCIQTKTLIKNSCWKCDNNDKLLSIIFLLLQRNDSVLSHPPFQLHFAIALAISLVLYPSFSLHTLCLLIQTLLSGIALVCIFSLIYMVHTCFTLSLTYSPSLSYFSYLS